MTFRMREFLLFAAVVLFVVFAAITDGLIHTDDSLPILGLALAAFAASFLRMAA